MLTGGDLVMGSFDFKTHLLQRHADFTASAFAVIQRTKIEVTGFIAGFGSRATLFVRLEQEKLAFRADVEGISHIRCFLQNLLQHAAGISDKGGAVGIVYIADQARNPSVLRPPGQNGEGIQIRIQVLVALLNAGEAFDGAAVDHDLVVYGLLNLACSDCHILELTEDIGKLHADKFHIAILDHFDDVFSGILTHDLYLPEKIKKSEGCSATSHPCSVRENNSTTFFRCQAHF